MCRDAEVQSSSAGILEGVLNRANATPEHQQTMGSLMPSILSGLVFALELDAAPAEPTTVVSITKTGQPLGAQSTSHL